MVKKEFEIRKEMDKLSHKSYEGVLEYLNSILQMFFWGMILVPQSETINVIEEIWLVVIILLSIFVVFRRKIFWESSNKYFSMFKTCGLIIINTIVLILSMVFLAAFFIKMQKWLILVISLILMLMNFINFAFTIQIEEISKNLPESIKNSVKRNKLLDMLEKKDVNINTKIFENIWDTDYKSSSKYSSYIHVSYDKRKSWILFLKTLDDTTIYHLEYITRSRVRDRPTSLKLYKDTLYFLGFLVDILPIIKKMTINTGDLAGINFYIIIASLLLLMTSAEAGYLKKHEDDLTNDLILSMIEEIKKS
ncbi:hypothetical protein [Companilactobacillus kedongensis]|uniref:hypothetical protein n=1 Tax=Companilactobacillus kedongensis TaxID=2486004 RepID=UPI000F7942C0|nr:hypothetical protein [Companilactobacillus kedongensis]